VAQAEAPPLPHARGRLLSPIFRAKLRDGLIAAGLTDSVPEKIWKQDWVVHVKHAGTGQEMIEYLGRYLFRPRSPTDASSVSKPAESRSDTATAGPAIEHAAA